MAAPAVHFLLVTDSAQHVCDLAKQASESLVEIRSTLPADAQSRCEPIVSLLNDIHLLWKELIPSARLLDPGSIYQGLAFDWNNLASCCRVVLYSVDCVIRKCGEYMVDHRYHDQLREILHSEPNQDRPSNLRDQLERVAEALEHMQDVCECESAEEQEQELCDPKTRRLLDEVYDDSRHILATATEVPPFMKYQLGKSPMEWKFSRIPSTGRASEMYNISNPLEKSHMGPGARLRSAGRSWRDMVSRMVPEDTPQQARSNEIDKYLERESQKPHPFLIHLWASIYNRCKLPQLFRLDTQVNEISRETVLQYTLRYMKNYVDRGEVFEQLEQELSTENGAISADTTEKIISALVGKVKHFKVSDEIHATLRQNQFHPSSNYVERHLLRLVSKESVLTEDDIFECVHCDHRLLQQVNFPKAKVILGAPWPSSLVHKKYFDIAGHDHAVGLLPINLPNYLDFPSVTWDYYNGFQTDVPTKFDDMEGLFRTNWSLRTTIVALFTGFDDFKKMLQLVPFKDIWPSYDGPEEAFAVVRFILDQLMRYNRNFNIIALVLDNYQIASREQFRDAIQEEALQNVLRP